MRLAYGSWRRLRGLGYVLPAALSIAWGVGPSQAAPTRLKIKNGNRITVALDKSREAAVGIRPEKETWTLLLTTALEDASADLRDVTPNVTSVRWTVPVAADRIVLDQSRFLASHVYRIEIRREGQLLGSAFVYLYPPPPPPSVNRVEFEGEKEPEQEKSSERAPLPKGGL